MNWLIKTFSSSIGQKVIMALTGLFLSSFLVIHLIGNLQLLIDDYGYKFNAYAKFMTSNPLIKTAGYITYLSILLHAFRGILLVSKNRAARSKGYKKFEGSANSTWMSRSMGVLGTIIFVFIIIHMQQFWYQYKFGGTVEKQEYTIITTEEGKEKIFSGKEMDKMREDLGAIVGKYQATQDQEGFENDPVYKQYEPMLKELEAAQASGAIKTETYKDLYSVVKATYSDILYVLLYVIAMIAIAFHLLHGFSSAFQTMGWKHPKYNGLINAVTWFIGIIVPAGFAAIPLIMYFS